MLVPVCVCVCVCTWCAADGDMYCVPAVSLTTRDPSLPAALHPQPIELPEG